MRALSLRPGRTEDGKIYEKLINQRLTAELERSDGLHESQYGFRKGRSTTDAIARIMQLADTVNSGSYKSRKCSGYPGY